MMTCEEHREAARYARLDRALRDWATAIVWASVTVWAVFVWVAYCMGWGV